MAVVTGRLLKALKLTTNCKCTASESVTKNATFTFTFSGFFFILVNVKHYGFFEALKK